MRAVVQEVAGIGSRLAERSEVKKRKAGDAEAKRVKRVCWTCGMVSPLCLYCSDELPRSTDTAN